MTPQALEQLINQGEGRHLEFKTSFGREAIESVAAFANSKGGGVLLVGVADNGAVAGINYSEESIQSYANQIKNATEPSLIVDIEAVSFDSKKLLYIKVNEYPVRPVSCKGKYFKRVENSNHQMNLTEIANMHLQSLQLSWDAYEAYEFSYEDLDVYKIERFLARLKEKGRYRVTQDPIHDLKKLNLLKENNQPTNAARLLFAKEQTVYNIHLGRFKTPSMILDDKMIRLPLFEAVEETMMYILAHIKVAFEFSGEIQRKEVFEYPLNALREIVLNAIVHRDYTSPIDTQIKIFDNKITFFNPGKLYGDITVEKLATDTYQAQTRNKLIAEAFYLTGEIEKYGSGYIRIRDEISAYPGMRLDFEEMGNGYLVTLSYEVNEGVSEGASEGVSEGVTTGPNQLLMLITEIPGLRTTQISQSLNVPIKTLERWLKTLRDEDKVEFRGASKTGGYFSIEDRDENK